MKHDAWRHQPDQYTATYTIEPRWADVDVLRHLNNSALHGLHQEARLRFLAGRIGDGFWRAPRGPRLLARRVSTDFLEQSHYPQALTAAVKVTALDARHLVLASGLFQRGRCVGLQSTHCLAYERGQTIELPAAWLRSLDAPTRADSPDGGVGESTPPALAQYPLRRHLDSRFADLDATGRTSELALMRGAEVGRSLLLRAAFAAVEGGEGRFGLGLFAARVDLHLYRASPAPPQWTLASGVTHLGRSSVVARVGFFDGETCTAMADCVLVFVDRDQGTPVPMPEAVRRVLDERRLHG